MSWAFGRTLLVSLFLIGLFSSAEAKSVALVIGNSAYVHATPLKNPKNDARAVSAILKKLGFEVVTGTDLTRTQLEGKAREFAQVARGAKVALFFYAGHGLQVNGSNYLAPIDAKLGDEADLVFETVRLGDILAQMERERRTNLVFLDACRDNPLARNLARSMGTRSTSVGRGLARIESGVGSLIAFATQPGNVALDGDGDNSPFTQALLKHIETPGLEVEALMRRVRVDVMAATNERQVPWSNSSLTGKFAFLKGKPIAASSTPRANDEKFAALQKQLETLKSKLEAKPKTKAAIPQKKMDETRVAVGVFPESKKKAASAGAFVPGYEFQDCNQCPKMVVVPAGSFMMGSPDSEPKRDVSEGPRHLVTISKPFAVGKFEVTKAQFETFTKETRYSAGNKCRVDMGDIWLFLLNRNFRNPGFSQTGSHPAVCINKEDAMTFSNWLSKKTGKSYRLPSEAEWEYAARAGTTTAFSTGDTITTEQANFDGNDTYNGSRKGKNRNKTAPVGSFKANAFGLHDMHGNVLEWVQDCWNYFYSIDENLPNIGAARRSGKCDRSVFRGGSWNREPAFMRSAKREATFVKFNMERHSSHGFRVVRELTETELGR